MPRKAAGLGDIAPSRFDRRAADGYFTIDSDWIIPALARAVQIEAPVLDRTSESASVTGTS